MIRAWHAIPVAVAVAVATTLATVATGQQGSTTQAAALQPPSITVNGSASVAAPATVDDNSGAPATGTTGPTDTDAAYQTALGQALANAKAKAQFVASQEGVTLGALQTVVEQSDGPNGGGPCGPVEFASSGVAAAPSVKHRAKSRAKVKVRAKTKSQLLGSFAAASAAGMPHARASLVVGCSLTAQVTITYLIGGPASTTTTSTSQSTATPATSTSVTTTTTTST